MCQQQVDFEWRVVDGASTDGTPQWLAQLNDPRLRWTSQPDKGLFDAMNKGIEDTQGEYLIFMNSGDLFNDSLVLKRTQDHLTRVQRLPLLAYGDSIDYTLEGSRNLRRARSYKRVYRGMFAQHQAMFFKRSAMRYDLNYPLTADYVFVAQTLDLAADNNEDVMQLDYPVCQFLLGGLNEKRRFKALREDYRCRRTVMNLSPLTCMALFCAHFVHSIVKRSTPRLAKLMRS